MRDSFNNVDISIRRLTDNGLKCIFIHGAGVQAPNGPELRNEMDSYWGSSTRTNPPPYCASVQYVSLDTLTRPFTDSNLQDEFVNLIMDQEKLERTVLITHGTAGLMLADAIAKEKIQLSKTTRWFGLNVPQEGTHLPQYMRNHCSENNSEFKTLLQQMNTGSLTCDTVNQPGFDQIQLSPRALATYRLHISAALCGISPSNDPETTKAFQALMETPESERKALLTLSDGMTRVGDCLDVEHDQISTRSEILATSYWDSQMKTADRISEKGGVQKFLHSTVVKSVVDLFTK